MGTIINNTQNLKKMYNIVNVFDDVWLEENTEENAWISLDTETKFKKIPIRYFRKKLSNIHIPFIYSFPDSTFHDDDFDSHDRECEVCEKLLKEEISKGNIVYVMIGRENYLSKDYIFPLYTDKEQFTTYEFLIQLKKRWEKIYEEEGCEGNILGLRNRRSTKKNMV